MNQSKEEEIIEDIKKVTDLVTVANSPGGKQLVAVMVEDIVSNIEGLLAGRYTMTHMELVTSICDIKAKLDVVRVINRAESNEDFLKGLLAETLQR